MRNVNSVSVPRVIEAPRAARNRGARVSTAGAGLFSSTQPAAALIGASVGLRDVIKSAMEATSPHNIQVANPM